MPVHEVGPDSNGFFYRAVTTAEWSSSYGEQLRAQGYRYCGYGTWGIYVAPAGEPCSYKKDQAPTQPPGPMILPPAETTGGSGSPPAPVSIPKGCGCGSGAGSAVPGPTGAPAAPSPTPAPTKAATMVVDHLRGLPWWVYVLAALVAAQAVRRG